MQKVKPRDLGAGSACWLTLLSSRQITHTLQTVTSDAPGISVVSGYPEGCPPDRDPPVGFLSECAAPRSCSGIKDRGTELAASRVPGSCERRSCCGYGVRRQQEGGPGAASAGLGQARRSKSSRRRRCGATARGGGPGGAEDTGGSLPSQVRPPGPCQVKRHVRNWPGTGLTKKIPWPRPPQGFLQLDSILDRVLSDDRPLIYPSLPF